MPGNGDLTITSLRRSWLYRNRVIGPSLFSNSFRNVGKPVLEWTDIYDSVFASESKLLIILSKWAETH